MSRFVSVDDVLVLLTGASSKLTEYLGHYASHFKVHLQTPLGAGLTTLSLYLIACKVLRFRRVRKLEKKYRKRTNEKDAKVTIGRPDVTLTPQEMQDIMLTSLEYDMPNLMFYALTFALFKTYGIPTISEILLKTEQLSVKNNVSRRVADTAILVSVWMHCPYIDARKMDIGDLDNVDSRGALALARTNWLHNRYPQIKNDDFLYTMSLFVMEPAHWAKAYGWRELLPIEQEAYFQYWRLMGDRMNIKDIPENLADLHAWAEAYEEVHMVAAPSNFEVANHTIDHLLRGVPYTFGLHSFMEQTVHSMLEDRVREAMMLPKPPAGPRMLAKSILAISSFFHGYLSLPRIRPYEYTPRELPEHQRGKDMPRMHPAAFEFEPWYKPEPTGIAWLWQTLLVKTGLKDSAYIPGPRYKSDGFRIEEMGPKSLENSGHADVMKMAEDIQGCPVKGPWARKTR